MSTQNDNIAILLANRYYLYRLLQRIFADEPSKELMAIVTNEHTKEALQLLIYEDDNQFDPDIDLLGQLKEAITADSKGTLDELKSEYTALLIGPTQLPAPPWESVYVTKEPTLFQESTLEVRRAYLKYDFLPANYPHEADDHLALELDFMAHLAELTQKSFEAEKNDEAKKTLLDQKYFLEKHLLVWIGDFAKQIQESKTHHLYPQMAILTEKVLKLDAALVEELISLL